MDGSGPLAGRVRLALRGCIVTAEEGKPGLRHLPDGVLCADEHGRVLLVEPAASARRRYPGPVRDLGSAALLPGFVDAHTHYPQTRIIGRATGPLLSWLERTVFPEEERFRSLRYATEVARAFVDRLVGAGTTSAAVFSSPSPPATAALCAEIEARGLRALVGLTLMDQRCPAPLRLGRAAARRAMARLARDWHERDGRIHIAVTPRFALSCSRGMLEDAGRMAADLGLPVQTHVSEHPAEAEAVLRAHPYARDYLDVYARAGLLGERTVLAHAVHLRAGAWSRVRAAGAAIAHCPDSNFFLASGRLRVAAALGRGIRVGLGTDVAAGRSFSLRRAMASAYDNAQCVGRPLEPAALLRMATLGGAEALGLGGSTGSLEPGKDADLVVVDLPEGTDRRSLTSVLAAVLFDTDAAAVREIWVRGKRLALARPSPLG
jgi:guanine deaminase